MDSQRNSAKSCRYFMAPYRNEVSDESVVIAMEMRWPTRLFSLMAAWLHADEDFLVEASTPRHLVHGILPPRQASNRSLVVCSTSKDGYTNNQFVGAVLLQSPSGRRPCRREA